MALICCECFGLVWGVSWGLITSTVVLIWNIQLSKTDLQFFGEKVLVFYFFRHTQHSTPASRKSRWHKSHKGVVVQLAVITTIEIFSVIVVPNDKSKTCNVLITSGYCKELEIFIAENLPPLHRTVQYSTVLYLIMDGVERR